jgi:hypothetical protein
MLLLYAVPGTSKLKIQLTIRFAATAEGANPVHPLTEGQ